MLLPAPNRVARSYGHVLQMDIDCVPQASGCIVSDDDVLAPATAESACPLDQPRAGRIDGRPGVVAAVLVPVLTGVVGKAAAAGRVIALESVPICIPSVGIDSIAEWVIESVERIRPSAPECRDQWDDP
jgi:hypothetical protein